MALQEYPLNAMSCRKRLLSGGPSPPNRSVILADSRQRRILALLLAQSDPIPEDALASQLAVQKAKAEDLPSSVVQELHRQIRIDLYHRCLPELESVGWIERQPTGIVSTEQLPVECVEESFTEGDGSWEALAALLVRPRRQRVASTIADHTQPLSLEELSTALTASEQSWWTAGGVDDESMLPTILHHIDLPILENVGLIEYNSDEKIITQQQHLEMVLDQADVANGSNDTATTDS